MKNNKQGFAGLSAILIVVFVALIGVGMLIYTTRIANQKPAPAVNQEPMRQATTTQSEPLALQNVTINEGTDSKAKNQELSQNATPKNISPWKEFNSSDGRFAIAMPTEPKYQSTPNVKFNQATDNYTSQNTHGNQYMVQVFYYGSSEDAKNADTILGKSLNTLIVSPINNDIITSTVGSFGNYRAVDYSMRYNNYDNELAINMKGKLILVDRIIYNLMAIYQGQDYSDYNKFINSFVLR